MTPSIVSTSVRAFAITMLVAASLPGRSVAGEAEQSDELALNAVFGDEFIAENVAVVSRRAAQLEDEDCFRFLAQWVLPSGTHATIRMNAAFTVASSAAGGDDGASREVPAVSGPAGTELTCPAVELVRVAERIGRLEQLRDRVLRLPDTVQEEQQRAKAAMLFLIDLADRDLTSAAQHASTLATLAQNRSEFAENRQWPQLVAAWVGLRDPQAWQLVPEFVIDLRTRQLLEREPGSSGWSQQVASLHGLWQHLQSGKGVSSFTRPPPLKNWIPSEVVTERSKTAGFPAGHWRWQGPELQNLSSHAQSLLFYTVPLRGDFEISCSLPFGAVEELQLMYAGEYALPAADWQGARTGSVRGEDLAPLDPPITKPHGPPWLRILVQDHVCTTWFNGRVLARRRLPRDHDPWLVVRATSSRHHPAIRDLRIDGTPDVPGEVNLCAHASLAGWWSYFEDEEIGSGLAWQYVEDERGQGLFAPRRAGSVRTDRQSLLRYYRPLADGDSLEYDFFYEADRTLVHPALDDVAFLLQPDGVGERPIRDGTDAPRDGDLHAAPGGSRRGPRQLPWREKQWNQCRLTLRGGVVELSLNGQLVYSRPLAAARPPVFGFYRDADQHEVQLRNVVWRHASPRAFADVERQLVRRDLGPPDSKLAAQETFEHDFVEQGLPAELFDIPSGGNLQVRVTPDGVRHSQTSGGGWVDSTIVPVFRMRGDFDAIVSFADFRINQGDYGGCAVVLRSEDGRVMLLSRRVRDANLQRVYLTWRAPVGDGEFRMVAQVLITEATRGRFRVARRGDTYYFLIAEYDSRVFRLVGEQTIEGAGRQAAQVELRMIASNGSTASAVWRNAQFAAEGLTRFRFQATDRVVSDQQWATIAAAPELRELILDRTNVQDEDLARLVRNPELRLLYLKGTPITSRGVRHLAELKRLENLHLTSAGVDDTCGAVLGRLSELQSLGLSSTNVGDTVVGELSRLTKLRVLGLRRTPVTDQAVRHFEKMKSLERLDLRGAAVSPAGVERIRKALPECTVEF